MKTLTALLLASALSAAAENIVIVWDALPAPVTGYKVYSSTNFGTTWKFEIGAAGNTGTVTATINALTNYTTIGVSATNSVTENEKELVDLLPMVRNIRVNGSTISWDISPVPATGYNVSVSSNLVNWPVLTVVSGRTNNSVTLQNMPDSILAVGVRSTSTNSMSLRSTAEVLKPVTGLRIVEVP